METTSHRQGALVTGRDLIVISLEPKERSLLATPTVSTYDTLELAARPPEMTQE